MKDGVCGRVCEFPTIWLIALTIILLIFLATDCNVFSLLLPSQNQCQNSDQELKSGHFCPVSHK